MSPAAADQTATPARRRPRPRFRPVQVVAVTRPAPRLVCVTVGGPALEGFEIGGPTQHIKVLFPAPGEREVAVPEPGPDGPVWPDDRPRPTMRTYTPRRSDEAAGTLDIEIVLHGEGPASSWAAAATVGDELAVAGPGGRLPLDLDGGSWVVAGDESALPAVGTLLDVLPAGTDVQVYLEVDGVADEIDLPSVAAARVTWLHRHDGDRPGDRLASALASADLGTDVQVWVACEATAVRRVRRDLLGGDRVDAGRLVTRGYWHLGEENHPDHDYGEDG